jgi:perosamine synthetase
VCRELHEQGVDTRPFFVPMSDLPHLAGCRIVGAEAICDAGRQADPATRHAASPVTRSLSQRGFNLPSGCGLSDDDVHFCAETLARVLDRRHSARQKRPTAARHRERPN